MMPPLTLGPYQIESEIGSGSMGAVYRATDTRLKRSVAIKLWRHDGGDDALSARRLMKEARAASSLNHPNIVIVHDYGETDEGGAFMVQELIDGRTLRDVMQARLSLGETLDVAAQMARALAAAHAAGVVHRDVKPENVMVRTDGYVKVLDFGIAHLPLPASGTLGTAIETLAHDIIGTPAYMAPEMMLGDEIGPPADVFALGVTLYELLTGRAPFSGPTAIATMTKIATEAPAPPATVEPSIPPGLDALVLAMLDKDPARRPTAAEVERSLPAFGALMEPEALLQPERITFTVGREAELSQLEALYAGARAGRSRLVGVHGEPGIGKSTLLESFMQQLERAPERPIVVRVRCSESLAGSEAYLPVLEAMESLRTRGHHSLDSLMRSVAPTWHAQVATAAPGEPRPSISSPERLKRELRAFLSEASRRAPLVWLVEDLHWADVSTVDILNYLAGRLEDMRLMIVTAFRLSDMTLARHPFLAVRADLQATDVYAEIGLTFLAADDVARYLALRFPSNDFPASFIAAVHRRTEGSPLFMADLVLYLRDTGTIVERDGVWTVADEQSDMTRELPESLRGMIARKIERATEEDRRALLAASVQGEEFDAAPLGEALGIDALAIEDRLEALQTVHGLVHRGEEVEYPDGTLTLRNRFVHVLYQNVLYGTLPPTRRVQLSGRTAQALAGHYGTEAGPVAGRLAVLFEAARDFGAAGRHFLLAAQRATALSAFREALTLTQRGLDSVARMPEDDARRQLELGLQMTRALAQRMVFGWVAAELEETLARARLLCQEMADAPQLFPVLWNLAFSHMLRGNLEIARTHVEDLAVKAEASGEPAFRMAAAHLAGVTAEFAGDVRESSRQLELGRSLHDPARAAEYRRLFGMDPGMHARPMSSRPLWALGHADRALERARETVVLAEGQRQPLVLVFSKIVLQGVHLYRGEAAEAIVLGDEIIRRCEEYGFPQETAWARGFRGAALSLTGAADEGPRELAACLETLAALRSGLVRTMFLSLHAESLWRAGQLDEGLAVVAEGFAYAERTGEHGFVHELHRIRGALHLAQGRTADAEAALREALAFARARDARSFELRAATGLAALLGATGRAAEGRAMLAPVLECFTEGHGTMDLRNAQAMLDDLQERP